MVQWRSGAIVAPATSQTEAVWHEDPANVGRKAYRRATIVQKGTLAVLLLTGLSGCMVTGPDTNSRSKTIRSGQSFGECLGYCRLELELTEDTTIFAAIGQALDNSFDDIRDTVATDSGTWAHVSALAAIAPFSTLDEVYGCPDCADGGAEWVELDTDRDPARTVTFEYGDPPAQIDALADTLRSIRAAMFDERVKSADVLP